MPLYTKFLKDLLTKKGKYINNESIVVEGNCSVNGEGSTPKDPLYKILDELKVVEIKTREKRKR